ncbi:MAG: MATE family efflux transporter [Clostridia bacterium]|nr:MATE family efflux transporter [Clostridia bacterium]
MQKDRAFLEKEPVGKLLLRLALPTVIAQLVNMLYNIIDRIYIGHMPGDGAMALTGVGVCMPLIMAVSAFAALVSAGGAPRASIFMGRKDQDTAEKILGNCFSLLLVMSAVLTCLLLVFNRELLLLFGASEQTIGYAAAYMRIYAAGTVFVQLTLGLNMFITAQGFAKISMMTVLIGAILNIVLDPFLIFTLHLGVEGAALATLLAQAVSCVWCLMFLLGKKTTLRIRRERMRMERRILVPCILLGMAQFIMQVTESVIQVCFNSSLLKYGGDIAVGAMTICTSTMQFALLPMTGVGQGAQPIASYNYGAKKGARVRETFRLLLKVNLVYSFLLYLILMLFPAGFARIFSEDPALIAYSARALRIYCAVLCIFGVQMACQQIFTSIGYAGCSIIVALVRKAVLLIPLIYLLPALGILGDRAMDVYLAEPVADTLAISFTAILFRFQFRKAMNRLEEKKVDGVPA